MRARQRSGKASTSILLTVKSAATPPTPQTIATSALTNWGALLLRRKRNPAQRTATMTIKPASAAKKRPGAAFPAATGTGFCGSSSIVCCIFLSPLARPVPGPAWSLVAGAAYGPASPDGGRIAGGSGRRRYPPPGWAGSVAAPGLLLDVRPALLNFGEGLVEVRVAADVVGHTLPEGARPDRARHEVRAVKAHGSGVQQRLGDFAVHCRAVGRNVGVFVRGEGAPGLDPTLDPVERGEVLHHGADFRPVAERGHQVAAELHRLAVLRVDRRQIVEVIVDAALDTRLGLLEEAGDEVALVVQPALRRIGEHRRRGIAEVRADDLLAAAIDVFIVEPDIGHQFDGVPDFRRGERQIAARPLVIVVQGRGAQHNVLDPVGRRPAGGRAALDADTPRRVAVLDDLVHERLLLGPGGGHFVAGGVKRLFGIPDQAFGVHALEDAAEDLAARGIHRRGIQIALVIVLLEPIGVDHFAGVDDLAGLGDAGHQARLREVGDIRGAAAFDPDVDRGLEFFRALVGDGNARGILER